MAQAARRGIGDRVHVLGRLSDADLAAVLDGALASVVPSRSEGFGLPLLEAMSRGVPVIHSDAPALVEVAGGAGLCVPVGDVDSLARAIGEITGNAMLREHLMAAGRLRSTKFSWERVAEKLWSVYGRVVSAHST